MRRILPLSALGAVLAACSPVSGPCQPEAGPVEGLACIEAPIYGPDFWTPEADHNTKLWQDAASACTDSAISAGDRCKVIAQVELVLVMRREAEAVRKRLLERTVPASPTDPNTGFTGIPPGLPSPSTSDSSAPNAPGSPDPETR